VDAIDFNETISGQWFISDTRFGPLVHARLGIAEENSGKLVSLVRRQAKLIAEDQNLDYIIVDGSPGVGCPVISSITGANAVLIVTEPTLSGIHDLERVVALSAGHFQIETHVAVNKYDLNPEMTEKIEKFCKENDVCFAGKIPYDETVTRAMVNGKNVIEYGDGQVAEAVREIWENLETKLLSK